MTPARTGFVVFAAALVGCAGNEPQPRIDAVDPAQAYTDGDIRLTLTGAGFIPSFRFDPVSGERAATMDGFSGRVGNQPLIDFGWVAPTQISASLDVQDPDDLGVGPCDVEITDPRGRKAGLSAGFFALGRYTFAPVWTIVSPAEGEVYAPAATIHADVTAAEQPPGQMTGLTWIYTEPGPDPETEGRSVSGACPLRPGPEQIDCSFDVTVSADLLPPTIVELHFIASDNAVPPNQAPKDLSILVMPRPTVSSVRPATGGVAGGTNVVIEGSGFVAGSRVSFGDSLLIPDGGIFVDANTITGYTPAQSAGSVDVNVQSRLGVASLVSGFAYQLPPQIVSISPISGTQGQTTRVQIFGDNFSDATKIYLGQALATAVRLPPVSPVSDGEIDVDVPGSTGLAWAWVWAFDADNGWTRAPVPFSWTAQ